ncbi:hypothetical protein IT570_05300 [Candidatus Sumerlaeota bacterium]|nr:hypothetical protein [Candidatus Sumerlaeota bacterium]
MANRLPVILLVALLCVGMMTHASASIVLLEEKNRSTETTWRLTFTPRLVTEQAARDHVLMAQIPEAAGSSASRKPTPDEVDSRRESALIATGDAEDFDAADWSIAFDDASIADAVAVTLEPVILGVTPGLRVMFAPKPSWKDPVTISVMQRHGGRKAAPAALPVDDMGLQIVREAFLNGAAIKTRAVAVRSRTEVALPQPIAPQKLVFTESLKGNVVSFQTNAGANAQINYHGLELALGSLPSDTYWAFVPKSPPSIAANDAIFVNQGGSASSPSVGTRTAFSTLSPAGAEVELWRTRIYEPNVFYDRATSLPLGERITAYRIVGTSSSFPSRNTPLQIDDVVTSDVISVRARLFGITDVVGFSPDHFAKIGVQGYQAELTGVWQDDEECFAGGFFYPNVRRARGPAPVAGRTVVVTHRTYAGGGAINIDGQGLDSVELGWHGKPRLGPSGRLLLKVEEAEQPRLITIGGFPAGTTTADVLLLDVTNESNPVELTGASIFNDETGTVAIEFEAGADAATFYAERRATIQALSLTTSSSFPAADIDFLRGFYVRHDDLAAALQPLLNERGAGFYSFDPQAAYDVYSHGQESPEAIRTAIATVSQLFGGGNRAAFPSITLVGTATLDRHNYLGLNRPYEVPTFIEESVPSAIDSTIRIETNVDAPYELLMGGDDLPDATVGRLPARSAAEVTAMVDRIVAHAGRENFLGLQNRPAVFTTDYDPATVTPDADFWPTMWVPTGLPSLVVDAMDYVTTNTVTNLPEFHPLDMNAAVHDAFTVAPLGPSLFFYFGHGNFNVWGPTGGQYFRATDIAAIDTDQQWPIVLTFTCFNGYYAVPGAAERALGEQWLLQPLNRGAVANIASAGIDYYDSEKLFSIEGIELLGLPGSNRPKTVGEMLVRARINFILEYPDQIETRHIHLLFGDPLTGLTITAGGSGFLFD